MKQILAGLMGLAAIAALFTQPQATAQGVAEGVRLCMQVLLPSLFPFMIVVSFLSLSGGLLLPAKMLSPLFRWLRLPDSLRDVWLASFLGGYPTGAHTLATLVRQGLMPRETAGRMLRCCVNPGPAFLLLAVGQSMFRSHHIGTLLLLSQAISSLALSALLCHSRLKEAPVPAKRLDSLSDAFVTAVSGASSAMLTIFAFVLAFSVAFSLLNVLGPHLKPLAAVLEVTLGCTIAAQLGGMVGLLLSAFFIGFGGFSVGFQVLVLARQAEIPTKGFWRARLFAGALNAGIFRLLLLFDKTAVVAAVADSMPPMPVWSYDRLLGATCIAAMLLISLKKLESPALKSKR